MTNQDPQAGKTTYPNISAVAGLDTSGAPRDLQFSCELEPGVNVHVVLPFKRIDVLRASWSDILDEVKKAVVAVKAEEKARLLRAAEEVG